MGLWSWLFPTPEQRLDKARRHLARGNAAEARLIALDLEIPGAREVVTAAEADLAGRNLDVALSWADAGDDDRAAAHLELAEQFHADPAALRETRGRIREIRAARDAEETRRRAERDARLLAVDPLGLSGGPSLLVDPPGDLVAEDAVELQARLDLLVEGYPEALRSGATALGAPFARAVLDLDDGRPDLALQTLLALPDDAPLVVWERARAAWALNDAAAAARELRRFAGLAGGHQPMGASHSGVLLAQILAESGDLHGGLHVLRDVRSRHDVGGFLFAQLLFATGGLAESEGILRGLIRSQCRYLPAYALLAEVRLRGGHRVEAMTALERAMDQTCATGRCGTVAPDLGITRALATLYLEDGLERERALELSASARGMVRQPSWDDLYLAALTAKATGAPEAADLAARTRELAPPVRRERLERYLPA